MGGKEPINKQQQQKQDVSVADEINEDPGTIDDDSMEEANKLTTDKEEYSSSRLSQQKELINSEETMGGRRHCVRGTWISGVKMSPSFAFFTLQPLLPCEKNDTNLQLLLPSSQEDEEDGSEEREDEIENIDVVLKSKDGWDDTIDEIWERLMRVITTSQERDELPRLRFRIHGYLERMRHDNKKFAPGDTPTCIHAERIHASTLATSFHEETATVFRAAISSNNKNPKQEGETSELNLISKSKMAISDENNNKDSLPAAIQSSANTTVKTKTNNRHGAKDKSRFSKFAQFILDEFGGYEVLRHPTVQQSSTASVLDVAGGAGGLAFELAIKRDIPTIVVDTKPLRWNSQQQRHIRFRQGCLDALESESDTLLKNSQLARNLYERFDYQKEEQVVQYQTLLDSSFILKNIDEEETACETTNGNSVIESKLRNLLLSNDGYGKRKVSVIVGCHPDQATDHIIDIGLALRIPWAIVPCCVFPSLFVERRIRANDGGTRLVRSYEDLCDWISQKDPRIQQGILPFRGRNKVFYWHPPHISK